MSTKPNKIKKGAGKSSKGTQHSMTAGGSNQYTLFLLYPVFAMMIVVPLAFGVYVDHISPELQKYWTNPIHIDLFHYWSAVAAVIIAGLMLLIILFSKKKDLLAKDRYARIILVLLLTYGLVSIISTVFALNRDLAIKGSPGKYEGLFVHLAYMTIVIYIMTLLRNRNIKKHIHLAIMVISGILTVFGIAQILKYDLILDTPIFDMLAKRVEGGMNTVEGLKLVSLTFGNPNYVGSYAALMIPMLLAISLDKDNNTTQRIFAGIINLATVLILWKSNSDAGLFGSFVGLVVFFILSLRWRLSGKKLILALIAILALSIGVTRLMIPDSKLFFENMGLFSQDEASESTFDPYYGLLMYNFEATDDGLIVSTVDGELRFVSGGKDALKVYDQENNAVPANYVEASNSYVLASPYQNVEYQFISVNVGYAQAVKLNYMGSNFIYFENNYESGLFLVDNGFQRTEPVHAAHFGFEGKERMGSGRGYIWSRSIPLLKSTLVKGYGPDNFLVAFPQNDYWAKMYTYGTLSTFTDKPHSMYLQWGVNNGVIALLALLAVFAMYIFRQTRELWRFRDDHNQWFKIGILCAVVGYLVTGIFNDSVTPVAPIFWALLGVGIVSQLNGKSVKAKGKK